MLFGLSEQSQNMGSKMDNIAVRTALVEKQITKPMTAPNLSWPEFAVEMSDFSKRVTNWLDEIGIDKRNVATASLQGLWTYEQFINMVPEWDAIVCQASMSEEEAIMLAKPSSRLYVNPWHREVFVYKKLFPDTSTCFINNWSLACFEQANTDELFDLDYDVIESEDVASQTFDYIFSYSWDVAADIQLLKDLILSLNPGGVLSIACSSMQTKLYRDDFHIHPYHDLHEVLINSQGCTYHQSGGYGRTVFIKD